MIITANAYTAGLTSEMIRNAINGDIQAEEQMFSHYEPYILKLAQTPFCDESGNIKYRIDKDIYMSLKLTLHEVVLKFKIG